MSALNIDRSAGPASTRTIRALSWRDARVVLGEVAAVQLGQRAGALDAGGPAADDDHVERPVVHERRVLVGRLPPLAGRGP